MVEAHWNWPIRWFCNVEWTGTPERLVQRTYWVLLTVWLYRQRGYINVCNLLGFNFLKTVCRYACVHTHSNAHCYCLFSTWNLCCTFTFLLIATLLWSRVSSWDIHLYLVLEFALGFIHKGRQHSGGRVVELNKDNSGLGRNGSTACWLGIRWNADVHIYSRAAKSLFC